ncbi:oxidoreductase [Pasteurellaceae bacterium Macca]|nr:oxidoreductase [Pasteurellaceae bacterium Macca]
MFQNFAMLSLGLFVFTMKTIPYQQFQRSLSWRHPSNAVIGKLPRTQFTGKESETISLSGTLMPEITGGSLSLTMLQIMAEQGKAYPLISGSTFLILGWFVIESIEQTGSFPFGDGAFRQIDFTLNLKRVDDSLFADVTDKIMSFL